MHIVADENIPLLESFCGGLGTLERVDGRRLTREQLLQADVLLVRSVTRIDRELLAGTPVRFVGTATIGTDHVDAAWLASQGISFASAPGCNASSVVQYVLSVLSLFLQYRLAKPGFTGITVGVIGAGNVGGALIRRLEQLGAEVRVSDPPREEALEDLPFASLKEVLACDIVSMHTPLTHSGQYPTHHLLGAEQLAWMRGNQLLINSGRGAAIDNQALLNRLSEPDAPTVVLDVWEGEPEPLPALVKACWLATPHIAGYSQEGKCRGTEMVAGALHDWAGRTMSCQLSDLLPVPALAAMAFSAEASPWDGLHRALMACYDPREDDARLRQSIRRDDGGAGFDALRKHYRVRREPASLQVEAPAGTELARVMARAGFAIS